MGKTVIRRDTYESESICIRVLLYVFWESPARHPVRNELEGVDGDTKEWCDVWVCQMLPRYGLLVEGL